MKKVAGFLFACLLLVLPLLYWPGWLFADQVKAFFLTLVFPLAFLLGPIRTAWRGGGLALTQPLAPLIGIFLVSTLSLTWTSSLALGLPALSGLLLGILLASYAGTHLEEERVLGIPMDRHGGERIFYPLCGAAGIAAAYGFFQSQGFDLPGMPFDTKSAPVSTFGNTNFASEFLAPMTAVALVWATRIKGWAYHLFLFGLFFLAAYITAAGVRAGWIAGTAGVVVASLLLLRHLPGRKKLRLLFPLFFLIVGVLGSWFLTPTPGPERIQRKASTIEVRKHLYLSTLDMLADHPVHGTGIGSFPSAYVPYRDPAEIKISTQHGKDPASSMVREPHNDYLLVSAELGLFGIVFLGWLGFWILARWRMAASSPAAMAAFAGLCALGVNALFRSPLSNPSSFLLLWVLIGVLAAETGALPRLHARKGLLTGVALIPVLLVLSWHGLAGFLSEIKLGAFFTTRSADLTELEEAASWSPWDEKKWEILGVWSSATGKVEPAAEAYERVLAINPNHVAARLNLAVLHLRAKQFDRSGPLLESLQPLALPAAKVHFALAWQAAGNGDDLAALSWITEGIGQGGSREHFKTLGSWVEQHALETKGDQGRALKYYDRHLKESPEDADTWMAMGQIFRNLDDETESRKFLARAHKLYGLDHLRGGDPHDATRQFRLYRRFTPQEDPLPDLYLAASHLAEKKREEARNILLELGRRGVTRQALIQPGLEKLFQDEELRNLLLD